VNDTIQIDLYTGKITDFIKFDTGNLCMVTGGANLGRIGVITNREKHPGSFDVVHMKDANGNSVATGLSNIFVIGKGNKPWISLPRGKGIRLTIAEERDKRLAAKQSSLAAKAAALAARPGALNLPRPRIDPTQQRNAPLSSAALGVPSGVIWRKEEDEVSLLLGERNCSQPLPSESVVSVCCRSTTAQIVSVVSVVLSVIDRALPLDLTPKVTATE
ncbi:hypothetical protein A6R68_15456, partial [Neotoma lepida]